MIKLKNDTIDVHELYHDLIKRFNYEEFIKRS